MRYIESDDKSQMIVHSPMLRTPVDYPLEFLAGFHFCKVLSPFKVMEWIYNDGILKTDGIADTDLVIYPESELFLQ